MLNAFIRKRKPYAFLLVLLLAPFYYYQYFVLYQKLKKTHTHTSKTNTGNLAYFCLYAICFQCSTQQMRCFRSNSKGRDQHNFVISASFITIFLKASADKVTSGSTCFYVVLSHVDPPVDPKNSDHGPMETRFLNSS